jgi:hypothetical protein
VTLDDDQRKHLDHIQAVIARMSTNSFLVKGWSLTVAAAIYGFVANHPRWQVAAIGLLPGFTFWGLDAYYLWQERLFRKLYAQVVAGGIAPYSMDIEPYKKEATWNGTLLSRTVLPVYLLIVTLGVVLIVDGATHR